MEKLVINAAFADCIRAIISHNDKEVPEWLLTKEITLYDDNSKEEMIKLFGKCDSFAIREGGVEFVVKRSQEEIDQYHQEQDDSLKYEIKKLKKWFNTKPEYQEQIEKYLKAKDLQWILDELNQNDVLDPVFNLQSAVDSLTESNKSPGPKIG